MYKKILNENLYRCVYCNKLFIKKKTRTFLGKEKPRCLICQFDKKEMTLP